MVLMHHSWITSLAARLLSKSHVTVSPKTWEYTVFFSRTSFYMNVKAEINQTFKNVLRRFLKLRVLIKNFFYFANLYIK